MGRTSSALALITSEGAKTLLEFLRYWYDTLSVTGEQVTWVIGPRSLLSITPSPLRLGPLNPPISKRQNPSRRFSG